MNKGRPSCKEYLLGMTNPTQLCGDIIIHHKGPYEATTIEQNQLKRLRLELFFLVNFFVRILPW